MTQPRPPQIPPDWPRSTRPLRLALLGWARLSAQERQGSGYNLNASELAAGLAMSGHTVFYLRSGQDYSIRPGLRIEHAENWRAIRCFHLFNSPNPSLARNNFQNPRGDAACPPITKAVLKWLDDNAIQLVHIHSLEGFSLDLIHAIKQSARPVVVTPHNHWYVCPQVDLLERERAACLDFDGGRKCVGCLPSPDPHTHIRQERWRQSIARTLGPQAPGAIDRTLAAARSLRHAMSRRGPVEVLHPDLDPELALGFNAGDAHTGLVNHGLTLLPSEHVPDLPPQPIDLNERMLAQTHHLKVLNDYATRRVAGIAALNHADVIASPSMYLAQILISMGLDPAKARKVQYGQPHFDRINRTARAPYYDRPPWTPSDPRPIRFGFFGTTWNNKGLDTLVRAIAHLAHEVRHRARFIIKAFGDEWPYRKRLSTYPEVSFLGGYDLYQLQTAANEFDVGVLPPIWFDNSPLVMLEFLHAGKPVVASRIGGVPEWINDRNGMLFPAASPDHLADRLTRIITGQASLPTPKQVHDSSPLQSYPAHVLELDAIYHSLL